MLIGHHTSVSKENTMIRVSLLLAIVDQAVASGASRMQVDFHHGLLGSFGVARWV